MLIESIAILVIVLIISYIILRKGKPNLSMSILPLTFTPAMYFISIPIADLFNDLFNWEINTIRIFLIFISALIASLVFGILSSKIKKKSFKTYYNVLCTGFTVVYAWILMLYFLK